MTLAYGSNLGLLVNAAPGEGHYTAFQQLLRGLDALVQCKVKSATTAAQPGSPADGDTYLLPTSSTGASWAGKDGKIARYSTIAAAWEFYTPQNGWETYAQDTGTKWRRVSSAWTSNLTVNGAFSATRNVAPIATDQASLITANAVNWLSGGSPTSQWATQFLAMNTVAGQTNVGQLNGQLIALYHSAGFTLPYWAGVETGAMFVDGASSVVTTGYGARFKYPTLTNGGTVVTFAPIYIPDDAATGITTAYAIQSDSRWVSKFAGRINIVRATDSVQMLMSRSGSSVGGIAFGGLGDRDTANTYDQWNIYNGALSKNISFRMTDAGVLSFFTAGLGQSIHFTDPTGSSSPSTGAIVIDTGGLGVGGSIFSGASIQALTSFKINGAQVVATRKTGWSPWTGTATRTSFATGSATLQNVAEALKALIDDLHSTAGHGLIGT